MLDVMPLALVVLFAVIAAGVVVANVVTSLRIARDDLGTVGEKIAQFLFVWLVPVVGAIFVFLLTRRNSEKGSGNYGSAKEQQDETPAVAWRDYGDAD